ncbi:MAG TPA: replication-associated recombination protein A [Coriobacteriia bacterium]|nr:replication-associated recombination protein A [Coriobacteriia bacterium]
MRDLFDDAAERRLEAEAPLAARMRPRTLDEFVGQHEAVGPGTVLRTAIELDAVSSLILYGPAGTGKTSLARIIAGMTEAHVTELSAVSAGVKDVRAVIEEARDRLKLENRRTVLFIDEIHRFNKSQQDALLHAVEDRLIVLIGATTENPFFEVNAPLISRSRVVEFVPLSDDDVRAIIERATNDTERGLGGSASIESAAIDRLVTFAGGDARIALTLLELAFQVAPRGPDGVAHLSEDDISRAAATRALPYDKGGDVHYDVISAFIKSMRGSDPDAAVYWLARMIHGGEDPKFIARRMLIFASEDVGMVDPQALLVAHAAFKAAESIGWPEARINLAHAAVYLALAPKSNAAYLAIDEALADVREGAARLVPDHLRDRHRPGSDRYPAYRYPHDYPGAHVEQQYLPDGLAGHRYYRPPGGVTPPHSVPPDEDEPAS